MRELGAWRLKHPCTGCGDGYGLCVQFLEFSMKCCKGCAHPGRWQENPYTEEDAEEMKAGK